MILQDLKGKFSTLKKVLSFIYKNYTIVAVFRDLLFLSSTAAEIYGITVFGKFIDATTQVLVEWKAFSLRHYLATDSFKYLALILLLWIVSQVCKQVREYLYTVIYEKTWSTTQSNMMGKVAQVYEDELDEEIRTISTSIEPILMVVLAIVAGGMVGAILLPIYSLVNGINV